MTLLSKNKIKYIRSLETKKARKEANAFLAEGTKLVEDLIGHFDCEMIVATQRWIDNHKNIQTSELIAVDHELLAKASLLKTPQEVLAVFKQPVYAIDPSILKVKLCLALDNIQDPGNLGTIIRVADWFGIEDLFCSINTVDVFNPKVIQATMGAIARVKVHYTSLTELIERNVDISVFGTFLDGDNIYQETLPNNGLIVMGNEGNGIGEEMEGMINKRLYIPNYPMNRDTSESLNVAIATSIVCAEFRRQASL